jgi:prepilin-type N-terminal cleavage/methylation domain-containing protein
MLKLPALRPQAGFSLLELAIVLMIIGTLMGGVLVAVGDSFESGRRSAALNQLRQIEEALYGFAASNGRLPCPAPALGGDGLEDCDLPDGVLPRILGLSGPTDTSGAVLDPWGNPYLYAVHAEYTDAVTLSTQFGSPVGPLLSVTSEEDCSGTVSSDVVVAVIFSRGANGITSSSSRELENSDGDECFVNTAYAEDVFDDQLVWISPYVLFNRMISAGRLP